MKHMIHLACFAVAICLLVGNAFAGDSPPNWKVFAAGSTDGPGDGSIGPDVDEFAGFSTDLGRFTGEGEHLLNPAAGTFVGYATYTASNGDQLYVEYAGSIVGIDPEAAYPYLVEGEFEVVGGTGRLANAEGSATRPAASPACRAICTSNSKAPCNRKESENRIQRFMIAKRNTGR